MRSLRSWSARTYSGSHSSFATNSTEQTGFGLFDYFDFGVIAMNAKVGERSVRRLFD